MVSCSITLSRSARCQVGGIARCVLEECFDELGRRRMGAGRRALSPRPTNLIGTSSSSTIATSTPPFAVESSLVMTTPVSSVAALKSLRLRDRVLPGRSVEHEQRLGRRRAELALDHAPHLLQLFHEVGLGLQPAGGVDQHDVDAARLRRHARRRRRPRPDRRPRRRERSRCRCARPKSPSCSAAAARNVSPATSITRLPSLRSRVASLPIVVVLPLPFTPTTRTTAGRGVEMQLGVRAASESVRRPCGSARRPDRSSSRLLAWRRSAGRRESSASSGTPKSARISVSSSSSQNSGVNGRSGRPSRVTAEKTLARPPE